VSEVDSLIYGINGGVPGGQTEYIHVQMGKKPPLCLVFNFKLGICARCNQGYYLQNGGLAKPIPNSNPPDYSKSDVCQVSRSPGGLISPEEYDLDLDALASGMLKIYFKNLEGFTPEVKKQWIRNLIGWKPSTVKNSYGRSPTYEEGGSMDLKLNPWKDFNDNIVLRNYDNPDWEFDHHMKFSVLDYELMMERGYLPIKVDYFEDVDGFYGGFGLRTKGMVPMKNNTNSTENPTPNPTDPISPPP
jgi:hypothetical protein